MITQLSSRMMKVQNNVGDDEDDSRTAEEDVNTAPSGSSNKKLTEENDVKTTFVRGEGDDHNTGGAGDEDEHHGVDRDDDEHK